MMLSGLVDRYQSFGESSYNMGVQKHFWPRATHTRYCGLVCRPPLLCLIYKRRLVLQNTTWRTALIFSVLAHCCDVGGNQVSPNHWYFRRFTHMHNVTLRTTSHEKFVSHSRHLFTQAYQIYYTYIQCTTIM